MSKIISLLLILPFSILHVSAQQTVLWKITHPESGKTSYLLGTYHTVSSSFVDAHPVIKEKLASTELLISETKIDKATSKAYFGKREETDTLDQVLSKEDISYINSFLKSNLYKLTPGEIFVTFNSNYQRFKCGLSNLQDTILMDEYLQKLAAAQNQQFYFLEEAQMELFTQLVSVYDWKFFASHIQPVLKLYRKDKPDKSRCRDYEDYLQVKPDYQLKAKSTDIASMDSRNENWLKTIPGLLEKNNCFIAVGLFHLYYKTGLIAQLRQIGYTVEPVDM